jgi:hypothetical protein
VTLLQLELAFGARQWHDQARCGRRSAQPVSQGHAPSPHPMPEGSSLSRSCQPSPESSAFGLLEVDRNTHRRVERPDDLVVNFGRLSDQRIKGGLPLGLMRGRLPSRRIRLFWRFVVSEKSGTAAALFRLRILRTRRTFPRIDSLNRQPLEKSSRWRFAHT